MVRSLLSTSIIHVPVPPEARLQLAPWQNIVEAVETEESAMTTLIAPQLQWPLMGMVKTSTRQCESAGGQLCLVVNGGGLDR